MVSPRQLLAVKPISTVIPLSIVIKDMPDAEANIASTRTQRVLEAGISAIFGKGITLLVNALSIPIAIRYLGPEMFGVWITISTSLSLLMVLDLGIANALTNLISEAYAKDSRELASRYSSCAFWMLWMVATALAAAGLLVYPRVSWGSLFHLHSEENINAASSAVATAYLIFLAGLPAGISAKLLGGYQQIRAANLVAASGSIASLAGLVLASKLHAGLAFLIGASAGAIVLTNYVGLIWLCTLHKPWLRPRLSYLSRPMLRQFLSGGVDLFILQLAGLIAFNSDNIVIVHYLGPSEVTPYSITWKLVCYAAALQIIITPALWPAYSEAYVRGDMQWIRSTLKTVMSYTMAAAATVCAVMIVFGKTIIRLWAGPAAVPRESLIIAMSAWILISTFMANTSTVLLASSKTRMQACLSVAAAALNLALSICWVQRIGSIGVILATVVSYLLILVGPQTWKVYAVLYARAGTASAVEVS